MRITIYHTGPVDFISRVLILFGAPVLGFISGGYIGSCIAEMFGFVGGNAEAVFCVLLIVLFIALYIYLGVKLKLWLEKFFRENL